MKLPPGLGETDSIVNPDGSAGGPKNPPAIECYESFLRRALGIPPNKSCLPKGVYRFKTHEESDAWEMRQIMRHAVCGQDIPQSLLLQQWALENGVTLDPPVDAKVTKSKLPRWLSKLLAWMFGRKS